MHFKKFPIFALYFSRNFLISYLAAKKDTQLNRVLIKYGKPSKNFAETPQNKVETPQLN